MTIAEKIDPNLIEDYQPHPGRKLTEKQFVAWCKDKTRAEWDDGEVIIMSPVTFRHIEIQNFLIAVLRMLCESRDLGSIGGPEYFVRFSQKKKQRHLPDVFFVAKSRAKLLLPTYMDGAPDAIFEIVSPESVARDWREKFTDYQTAGVREYWILDPMSQRVVAYTLVKGKYREISTEDNKLKSRAIAGFHFRPEWIKPGHLPKTIAAAREFGLLD